MCNLHRPINNFNLLAIRSNLVAFYLSHHSVSRKEVSCVKLNAWLIGENFHCPPLCSILHNAHKTHFVLKVSD